MSDLERNPAYLLWTEMQPPGDGVSEMLHVGAGGGTAWLWPLVDGAPPIGWDEASRYLVLPVLLVITQFISSAVITPPVDPKDDSAKNTQVRRRITQPV